MMKKILITFIISMLSPYAMATDATTEKLQLMQLYLDKNQLEKVEDLYDEEDSLSQNWMALERLAISFERREKYKQAVEIYQKIIGNLKYEKSRLPFYYYKLAFLNTQLFSKTNDYTPEEERSQYKAKANEYIVLARSEKVDNGELKLLEDLLQEKINRDESLVYKAGWYASLDIMSWQDRVILVNKSSSAKVNLLSTAMGPCLGGGRKWENVKYEFDLEGCFSVASATISSESKTVNYQQSSVTVKSVMVGPGVYFKTFSDNVLLGVHLPVKYRTGDWTNPNVNLYRFERNKALEAGYFIQSKIKIKNVSLRTRLGKVFPNPGSLWSVGILYDF